MDARQHTGSRGEALVAALLEDQGFAILARNVRVGRLEIDLIAERAGLLVFCEVRTRVHDALMDPAESITAAKVARVRRAAAAWLAQNARFHCEVRFDAASVVVGVEAADQPVIRYFESAF